ncbi:hypothetical protein LUZ60_001460 [Juncus effusus]|nr:hypothetical protein LUZ60_001460 [Juncus effusus]
MDMEMDISSDFIEDSDLAAALLRRFESSPHEDHQRLCAAVGAISQSLKDQSIPLTPVAYFGATSSSLDQLSKDSSSAADPVTASLLVFLSYCLPGVPAPVLRSKGGSICESIVRILGFGLVSESGVKAGLKCISRLIVAGDKSNWTSLKPFYDVVLRFAINHRPKVRKQAHMCLKEILQSFQKLTVLIPASESITSTFERFLLLAGGSNPQNPKPQTEQEGEKPKGAMEVLHMLTALKESLPLMAPKSSNIIMKYFKTLLDLRQPVVTRGILDILHAVCARQVNGVDSEVLLDLLCSLSLSVSAEEKSGDELASIARLLNIGMKKAYEINKDISVVKLPLIFNSLGDILASEHEEAVFAAFEGFKGLIDSCIDESLIEQGVKQIKLRKQGVKSGPSIVEKICVTFEGLLGIRYSSVWDLSFQILSAAFHTLGESVSYLMSEVVKSLVEMESLPDEDFSFRKQLHESLGAAVAAMGPNEFLRILKIKSINDENSWILPVLKQNIVGANLNFFLRDILNVINSTQETIHKLVNEDKLFSAKRAEGYVYSLWSLLVSFCNFPRDTASSFTDLQKVLLDKLCNEPDLRGIICSSLQILVQQNRNIVSEKSDDEILSKSEIRARDLYTKEFAEENLRVIRASCAKFFKAFHVLFLEASTETNGTLQPVIRELACIAERKVVKKAFRETMKELLSVTKELKTKQNDSADSMQLDNKSDSTNTRRAKLLDFAASFIPGLDLEEINVLLSAVKPAIQDEDGKIQKKAYKILSVILKDRDEFLERNLDSLLELMVASLPCHFQSKKYRLDCLYYIVVHIAKDSFEQRKVQVVTSFLTEILLALKEANTKTRNRAYDLLVEIGHACEEANNDGRNENLHRLFDMVLSGVTSEIPHMTSAAIKGLARLTYEFSDLIDEAYKLLPSAFLLLKMKNREIIKANLGFIKVLVAKSKAEGLQAHLKDLVEGILKWQNDTKNHFKAKVKLLIEMLVRKCGMDAVKLVMPEEHMKLLTNIRKINERKERKAKSADGSESLTSKTTMSRQSKWNHTRIFSDFGDSDEEEENYNSRANSLRSTITRRRKPSGSKTLSEDFTDSPGGDDPLDLLDHQTARHALHNSSKRKSHQLEDSEDPEFDSDGRLVIRTDSKKPKKDYKKSNDDDDGSDSKSYKSSKSHISNKTNKGNNNNNNNNNKRLKKGTESGWAYTGKEYTSKKAGGDFKKSDKLEPYAYWPLDRKLLNRRSERKAVARKGMASVMKKMTET